MKINFILFCSAVADYDIDDSDDYDWYDGMDHSAELKKEATALATVSPSTCYERCSKKCGYQAKA